MTKVMPEMKCEHLTKNEMKVAVETRGSECERNPWPVKSVG